MTATVPTPLITEREIGAAQLRVAIDEIRGQDTPAWIRQLARSRTGAVGTSKPSDDSGEDPAGSVPSVHDLEIARDRLSKDAAPAVRTALQAIFDKAIERMTLTVASAQH